MAGASVSYTGSWRPTTSVVALDPEVDFLILGDDFRICNRVGATTAVVCAKLILLVLSTSCCVSIDCRQAGGEEKCARSMLQLLPSSTWNLDTISTSSSFLTAISPLSGRMGSRVGRGFPGSQLSR